MKKSSGHQLESSPNKSLEEVSERVGYGRRVCHDLVKSGYDDPAPAEVSNNTIVVWTARRRWGGHEISCLSGQRRRSWVLQTWVLRFRPAGKMGSFLALLAGDDPAHSSYLALRVKLSRRYVPRVLL